MPIGSKAISGQWVEMREEATLGRIVFRSADADLPPARGRRRLDLDAHGMARAGQPGSDDRTRFGDAVSWSVSGDRLHIDAGEWRGNYTIKEADGTMLVLEPAN